MKELHGFISPFEEDYLRNLLLGSLWHSRLAHHCRRIDRVEFLRSERNPRDEGIQKMGRFVSKRMKEVFLISKEKQKTSAKIISISFHEKKDG